MFDSLLFGFCQFLLSTQSFSLVVWRHWQISWLPCTSWRRTLITWYNDFFSVNLGHMGYKNILWSYMHLCMRAGRGFPRTASSRHYPASPRELWGDLFRRTDCAQLPRQRVQRLPPGWDYKHSPRGNVTQLFTALWSHYASTHQMSAVMHHMQEP